jgi:hypothetical protein
MKDQILSIQSVSDLKKLGSYKDVRRHLQEKLTRKLQIKSRGWKDLYEIIEMLRSINAARISPNNLPNKNNDKQENFYFKSEVDQFIYALVELSGELQLKALGLNKSHFRDSKKAKQLRNTIAHKIHPDICNHPKAKDAMNKLTKLFNEVID